MAGKKIRCRNCNDVFVAEVTAQQPAPAPVGKGAEPAQQLDSSNMTGTRQAMIVPPSPEKDPYELNNLKPKLRPSLPQQFPGSVIIEAWLPLALCLVAAIWSVSETFGQNETGKAWVALLRVGVVAGLYLLFVAPVTFATVKKNFRELYRLLPPSPRLRTASTFAMPACFGYVFWTSFGSVASLITGIIMGLVFMAAVFWLVMHLDAQEAATAYAWACGAFLITTGISAGIIVGTNALLNQWMITGHVVAFKESPLGAGLAWTAPEPQRVKPRIVEAIDASVNTTDATSQPAATTQPDARTLVQASSRPAEQFATALNNVPPIHGPTSLATARQSNSAPATVPDEAAETPATRPQPQPSHTQLLLVPLPAAEAQGAAEKRVRAVFGAEFAKRSASDRDVLARKLLSASADAKNDPDLRFVMLRDSRDLAAQAGDASGAIEAADALAAGYQISKAESRMPVLEMGSKTIHSRKDAADYIAACDTAADELLHNDSYDNANRVMLWAKAAAVAAGATDLQAEVGKRAGVIRSIAAEYKRNETALKAAAQDPSNPTMNLRAGRFLCFAKADWEKGLPLLAKSSDAQLQSLAMADLAAPQESHDQLELGNRYWEWADHAQEPEKANAVARARHWYEKAYPSLSGLDKRPVQQRLDTNELWKLHRLAEGKEPEIIATPSGVTMTKDVRLITTDEFRVPLRIDAVAKTDRTNIRLYFGNQGTVIVGWEVNPLSLRYHQPGNGVIVAVPGKGAIPKDTWVHVTWIIHPDRGIVIVDGEVRAVVPGHNQGLIGTAGIGTHNLNHIDVKQFDVAEVGQ
jgi:hypothetical protein